MSGPSCLDKNTFVLEKRAGHFTYICAVSGVEGAESAHWCLRKGGCRRGLSDADITSMHNDAV